MTITLENAEKLAFARRVHNWPTYIVQTIIVEAHESEWYKLAKQWAETPPEFGGDVLPRACQFIVKVVDAGWDLVYGFTHYGPEVDRDVASAIEFILLCKFKVILQYDERVPSLSDEVKTGFDVFVEVIFGGPEAQKAHASILPYLYSHYPDPKTYINSLLTCDEKMQELMIYGVVIVTQKYMSLMAKFNQQIG